MTAERSQTRCAARKPLVVAACERLRIARYGSHRQPLQVKTGDFFDVGVAQSGLLGEARPVVNRIAFFLKNLFGVASRVGVEASEKVHPASGSAWAKKDFRFRSSGKARSKCLSSAPRRSAPSVQKAGRWPAIDPPAPQALFGSNPVPIAVASPVSPKRGRFPVLTIRLSKIVCVEF